MPLFARFERAASADSDALCSATTLHPGARGGGYLADGRPSIQACTRDRGMPLARWESKIGAGKLPSAISL